MKNFLPKNATSSKLLSGVITYFRAWKNFFSFSSVIFNIVILYSLFSSLASNKNRSLPYFVSVSIPVYIKLSKKEFYTWNIPRTRHISHIRLESYLESSHNWWRSFRKCNWRHSASCWNVHINRKGSRKRNYIGTSEASDKLLHALLGNFNSTTPRPATLSGQSAIARVLDVKQPTSGIHINIAQVFTIMTVKGTLSHTLRQPPCILVIYQWYNRS